MGELNSPIKYYNESSNTWIVHPTRRQLTTSEKRMGFSGPIQSIDYAISVSNSGDRILVHSGTYYVRSQLKKKNLSIIGLSDRCTMIIVKGENEYFSVSEDSNLYLESYPIFY